MLRDLLLLLLLLFWDLPLLLLVPLLGMFAISCAPHLLLLLQLVS